MYNKYRENAAQGNTTFLKAIIEQKQIFCVPWLLCHESLLFYNLLKNYKDDH